MPLEELGLHFCLSHMSNIWFNMNTCGQMVNSKQANKLPKISICVWALLRATEGPAARSASSGSAGTMACEHTALFLLRSYSFFFHLAKSQSAQTDLGVFFISTQCFFCLRLFTALICGILRGSIFRGDTYKANLIYP